MAGRRGSGGGGAGRRKVADTFFQVVVERSTASLLAVELGGRIRYASPAARRLLGVSEDEAAGLNLAMRCDDAQGARLLLYLDQLGAGSPVRSAYIEIDVRHADGALRTVEVMGVNLVGDPAVGGLLLQLVDVTGRARLEDQLAQLATTDALTGLANRRRLEEVLRDTEGDFERGDLHELAVCYLDLDRFKVINDSFGHDGGDRILQELARRLDDAVRDTDLVCRIGGDEFFIVLRDPGDLGPVMERLLGAMADPMPLGEESIAVGASIGVTTTATPVAWQELLRRADAALYRAKAVGRGCWVRYDAELEEWLVARRSELRDLQAEYLELRSSNAQLEEALLTDPRTALPNFARAERDLERAIEQGEGFAVAFIDVDDFGDFNKRYGHATGDVVLKAVAAALRGACRDGDTVYRYGGEEFLALLPGATEEEAAGVAERMRRQVEATAHQAAGLSDAVTVSIGVARRDTRADAPDVEVREAADLAMLRAKDRGKNRVELAPAP